jgi:hypothetical protein
MFQLIKPIIQVALWGALLGSASTQAVTLRYDLSGTTESASVAPTAAYPDQAYTGSFTFDNAALTGVGTETFALSSLSFTFLGQSFTAANAASTPLAYFSDGLFTGVEYSVSSLDPSFSLSPGFADTSDASFAYTPSSGIGAGYGSLAFQQIPEPFSLALLGIGFAAFRIARR